MALRTERFVVSETQVVGVVRSGSTYERKVKGKPSAGDDVEVLHSYALEIFLYEHHSLYLDYGPDKAARDADFEAVAVLIP